MSTPMSGNALIHCFFLRSRPYEDAPESSAYILPVHLNLSQPLTSRKYLVLAYISGRISRTHAILATQSLPMMGVPTIMVNSLVPPSLFMIFCACCPALPSTQVMLFSVEKTMPLTSEGAMPAFSTIALVVTQTAFQ